MILFIKHYLNASTDSKRHRQDAVDKICLDSHQTTMTVLPNSSTLHGHKHREIGNNTLKYDVELQV
jgi:hypothetical protein